MWTAIQKWSIRVSTLVGFIILGNLLSPLEFGIVALATTFINLLTTVADGGFASYVVQKKKLTDASLHTAFVVNSLMSLVLAAGLALLAPTFGELLDVPELSSVLPALAVSVLIAGTSVVPAALLSRDLRFRELAMRQVVASVVSIGVAIGLALAGAGVWALVAQTVVRAVVSSIALWVATDFRPRWRFDRGEAREMTGYGSKALAVNLQTQLRVMGQQFIIGALSGPVMLGYWTVAGRLVGVVLDVLSSVASAVAHPVFARLQDSPERLARALTKTRAMSALVVVPTLVLLSLVSEDVIPAVFGEQWAPTTTVASFLALSSLLVTIGSYDRSALLATGHPGAELRVTTVNMVIQLGLAVAFHSHLELLAATLVVSSGLMIPVRLVVVRRLLGVPVRGFAPTAAVFLAAGVAAAAVLGAAAAFDLSDLAYVVLAVVLGAAVYLGMVLLVARPLLLELVGLVQAVVRRRSGARTAHAS